jgi:perosamine synthetase
VSAAPIASFAAEIIDAVRRVVGPGTLALHEPLFVGNEWTYLKECLDTTFVSSVGRFVDRFEADLASFTGAKFAIAVVNGTAALHIALRLAGVQPLDEVLVPALTFIATSNAVAYCAAVPHFVDSEERTLGMDPQALREYLRSVTEQRSGLCVNRQSGRVIRALVPMHVFGHPADLDALAAVARDFKLAMIEDAAESIGSLYHGAHTGTLGLMGTLSFNGNKTMTTGGGGAVLTNDAALARHAKHLTTTAKVPHRWEYTHDELGYNYRLPNLNAALGCAQLEQLPRMIEAKRTLYRRYAESFAGMRGARIFAEPAGCHSNYWLQTLLLDESRARERDSILAVCNDAGVLTRPVWSLNHRAAAFRTSPRMALTVAESLERRVINLPSSARLILS